jgi:hypothetical protein
MNWDSIDWAELGRRANQTTAQLHTADLYGDAYYAELLRRVLTTGASGLTTAADADQARYNDVDRIAREKAEEALAQAQADLYRAQGDAAAEAAATLRGWCNDRTVPSRYRREGVELAATHLEALARFRRHVADRHSASLGTGTTQGTVTP